MKGSMGAQTTVFGLSTKKFYANGSLTRGEINFLRNMALKRSDPVELERWILSQTLARSKTIQKCKKRSVTLPHLNFIKGDA